MTPLGLVEAWCKILVAFIMWDKRPMEGEYSKPCVRLAIKNG